MRIQRILPNSQTLKQKIMSEVIDISELRIGRKRLIKTIFSVFMSDQWVRVMTLRKGFLNGMVCFASYLSSINLSQPLFNITLSISFPPYSKTKKVFDGFAKVELISGYASIGEKELMARLVYPDSDTENDIYLEVACYKSAIDKFVVEAEYDEFADLSLEIGSIPDGYLAKEFVLIKKTEDESGGG